VTELGEYGISGAQVAHAAELIRAGRLVAFPTETVYGLGANALDAAAVERIYEAKGRPHSSPIICHVSDLAMLHHLVADWSEAAQKLAEKFWPGPLTLVLPKTSAVPDLVTAGLPTVGVRMPAHPIALELLRAAGVPIAAPSANRFTQVSPTTAQHVRDSLGDRVDYILDGGPCLVGIESTVLTLAELTPILLRPGGISRQQIEEVIGPIASAPEQNSGQAHASPGLHPRHYSPRTRLYLVENGEVPEEGRGAYLQLFHPPRSAATELVVMPTSPSEYAAKLYGALHSLDAEGLDWIAVEGPPEIPEWEAVRDRLDRASYNGRYNTPESYP
jgi:L-threonylcarbamoyladenylate synthase